MDSFQNQDQYNNFYMQKPVQQEPQRNTNSVLALIFGILSLILCCCSVLAFIPAIISIVFYAKAKSNGEAGGMATGGLVCAIIGLIGAILFTVIYGIYFYIVFYIVQDLQNSGLLETIKNMNQTEIQEFIIQRYFGTL